MMKSVALFSICLMIPAGCARRNADDKSKPKLKALLARTDSVLVKNFFESVSLSPPVPSPHVEPVPGPSHLTITTLYFPGHLSFQPVTVYQPGKEKERLKGVLAEVLSPNWSVDGQSGKLQLHSSVLDENEARDLDSALTFQSSVIASWKAKAPNRHIEITFQSTDDFTVNLGSGGSEPILIVASGDYNGASLQIPLSEIPDLQSKLRKALHVLDLN